LVTRNEYVRLALEYSRPGMEIDLNFVETERALHLELQNLNWKFKPDAKFQKF
jgi:hypothetical protein